MGYIFVCDNVIILSVTHIIWEEFKLVMTNACINYLKQAELIDNVDEDIERFSRRLLKLKEGHSNHFRI